MSVLNSQTLRQMAGNLRRQATELEEMAEEMEGQQAKDGLALMERSCQGKRAYSTPEAAGQAASDRGVAGLRVYQCAFCNEYHLTKSTLEDFRERNER